MLPDCFYQQEGLLVSDADWCSLENFMEFVLGIGADVERELHCEPRAGEPTLPLSARPSLPQHA